LNSRFVFDASPLIHLAKAGQSGLVAELEGEKYTVPSVINEVINRGKELHYPDASVTESLVKNGILNVRALQRAEVRRIARVHKDIHLGESEVIALAKEMRAIALVDDRVARFVAKIQGIRTEGSYSVILRAVARGSMSADGAEEALGALVSSGWRCDAELYATLLTFARDLAARKARK